MKRVFLLFLMVMTTMIANAQYKKGQFLACTSNGVLLRTGPGKNYPAVLLNDNDKESSKIIVTNDPGFKGQGVDVSDSDEWFPIDKGIIYLGKSQNGYLYVECTLFGDIFDDSIFKGWVPARHLRAACSNCKGKFWWYLERDDLNYDLDDYTICPRCHGRGY